MAAVKNPLQRAYHHAMRLHVAAQTDTSKEPAASKARAKLRRLSEEASQQVKPGGRRQFLQEREQMQVPEASLPEAGPLPSGVERLINGHGGWKGITFGPSQVTRFETRDRAAMITAAENKAKGIKPTCPRMRHEYIPPYRPNADSAIRVKAEVQEADGMWVSGGFIEAYPKHGYYVVSTSEVPLHLLARCPGLGTKLYETAAKVACQQGTSLAGSPMRSAFSERFWQRQVQKGRANCGAGKADTYDSPMWTLGEALRTGDITVPEFNNLVRGLPAMPRGNKWDCMLVPLKNCPVDSLRGLRGAKRRYRIEGSHG